MQKGSLKTAGGYLLVLHTFEELSSSSDQLVRLLQRAKEEQDWDLCKELARFLMALDETGGTLRETLELVELRTPSDESAAANNISFYPSRLDVPRRNRNRMEVGMGINFSGGESSRSESRSPTSADSGRSVSAQQDYFGSSVSGGE